MDILEKLQDESQVIVVNADKNMVEVKMYEKVNNKWIPIMQTHGYIGKNGLGKEREGDWKTPVGLYEIGIAFGTKNDVQSNLDYYKLNEDMYWICDENSMYYNKFIDKTKVENDWDEIKNEHLIDEKIAYEYAIEIKYNKECERGKGSAIFLHCIKNGSTAGCVAIPSNDMKFVLENIKKTCKIYIY